MLIDILCSIENEISKEFLRSLVALGKFWLLVKCIFKVQFLTLVQLFLVGSLVELKAVALRDVHKVGVQEPLNHNCYELWVEACKYSLNLNYFSEQR
jgi:hypothetical protein